MNRRQVKLLFIICFLVNINFFYVNALDCSSWITDSTNFNEGFYNNTYLNLTGFIGIALENLSGNYVSNIFNVSRNATWDTLKFISKPYYGKSLPDNNTKEINGIDMTNNVVLYHFNETNGNLLDYSINKLNGSVIGNPIYQQESIFDKSIYFNGYNQYFTVLDNDLLSFTDGVSNDKPFSISLWVYKNSTNNEYYVRKGNGLEYDLYTYANTFRLTLYTDAINYIGRKTSLFSTDRKSVV